MHPYLEKYKFLFTKPSEFFKSVEGESEYWPILKFYVIFTVISQLVYLISIIPMLIKNSVFSGMYLYNFVQPIIFAFVNPFIISAIVFVGVYFLGGKAGFFNTFKPITYAMTIGVFYTIIMFIISGITNLFVPGLAEMDETTGIEVFQGSWFLIPIMIVLLILVLIYFVHIFIVAMAGITYYQQMTKMRAFVSIVVIPLIIVLLLISIFGAAFGGLLSPTLGMVQ